jgi:hypothetical protein
MNGNVGSIVVRFPTRMLSRACSGWSEELEVRSESDHLIALLVLEQNAAFWLP